MIIRQSQKADLDEIMDVIADARVRIGRLGIDQWQYGYPRRDILEEDIALGRSYVARTEEGELCGVYSLITDGEPTYDRIYEGAWLTGEGRAYAAIHRIAVAGAYCGTGVASQVIAHIFACARENGFVSVRVDTHSGNLPMRKMLEKNGFSYCGIIYLEDGQKRVAYEAVL